MSFRRLRTNTLTVSRVGWSQTIGTAPKPDCNRPVFASSSSTSPAKMRARLATFHRPRRLPFPNGLFVCLLLQIALWNVPVRASTASGYSSKPIPAAINSRYSVSVKNVDLPSTKPYTPGTIEVKGAAPSFVIKFNSASSKVNLFHQHESEKAPLTKESFSEDEPQILRHEVSKPIIQEIREVITPIRKIVQQINPVQESISTIISTSKLGGTSKQSIASLPNARLPDSIAAKLPLIFDKPSQGDAPDAKEDEENLEELEKPMPDLVLDETNLIDNSLYNGNSELDLKYVSPNGNEVAHMTYNDYEPKLYKDR